ncbi:MAG: YjjG family noncanonical pyrimidine nucleotidase [Spirochaetia bacterium]|jgi:2-haloacid dehalogenase
MNKYRGVLLDADNTLFDYDRAEAEALAETLRDAAPDGPRESAIAAYRVINARYWKLFEKGEIDSAGLQSGRWVDLFREMELSGDPAAAAGNYVTRLAEKAHLLPGAAVTVRELARRARLCLVTNGLSRVQRGRLAHSGIAGSFTAILISEELGVAKPDPRFFQAAGDALGLSPARLICVGDSPAADIAGARGAGIDACWFNPGGAPWPGPGDRPEHVIRDLDELLRIVPVPGVYP